MPSYVPPGPCTPWPPPCSPHSPALLPAYAGPLLTPFPLLGMPSPPLMHGLLQLQSHLHHEAFPSSFLLEHISIPSNLVCSSLCYMQYERVCIYLLSMYVCVCAHTCMRVFYVPNLTVNPSGEHPWHYKPFSSHLGYHSSLLAGLPTSSPGPLENPPSTQQPE